MQIFQQRAILHELSDDIYRLLERAHGVQLDKLAVSEFLHYLRLSEEVFGVHGTGLEGLDGDRGRVVPQPFPHLAELSVTEFPDEFQRRAVDFPLISRSVRETFGDRFLYLKST